MKPEPENPQIQKLYREMLLEEVDPASLKDEKKAFIAAHFKAAPVFSIRPVVWAPSFALCVAAFFVFVIRPQMAMRPVPAAVQQTAVQAGQAAAPAPAVLKAQPEAPAPAPVDKQSSSSDRIISVSHLSSDMGTPVVYHKTVEDVPVVVVWLFPHPSSLPVP